MLALHALLDGLEDVGIDRLPDRVSRGAYCVPQSLAALDLYPVTMRPCVFDRRSLACLCVWHRITSRKIIPLRIYNRLYANYTNIPV